MRKIALISSGFLPVPAVRGGGVEQLCTSFIEQNDIHKNVIIDLYTIDDKKINEIKYNYTKIYKIKINKFSSLICKIINKINKIINFNYYCDIYSKKLSSLIKNKEYDYIVIENNMFLYKTIRKKYSGKAKFIFHLHNDIDNYYKPKRLCEYIMNDAFKIITVSNYLKEHLIKITNGDEKKVTTVYNCVPSYKFSTNKNKNFLKKKYKIEDDDFVFLYCGRFSEEKGLLESIYAFNKLKLQKVKYIIVGSPETTTFLGIKYKNLYSKKIYSLASKNNNIIFTGYVDNNKLLDYYRSANVVIIPSICEEAFGLVAVEAMRCSKPVIATNSGGLVEVVDKSSSIIIDKENIIDNLYDSMLYYYENPKTATLMGKNGYKKVLNKYSENEFYINIINLLK